MENDIRKTPRLQGWDDEKIYFTDKENTEYCIHDNEEIYFILLEMCIKLFSKGLKEEHVCEEAEMLITSIRGND